MCEYKEDMDTTVSLTSLFCMNCFQNWESYWVTTVFWSLYFFDVRSSQEGVVMLICVLLTPFVLQVELRNSSL